jgi:DNA-binding NarL/FixJ family response regulator
MSNTHKLLSSLEKSVAFKAINEEKEPKYKKITCIFVADNWQDNYLRQLLEQESKIEIIGIDSESIDDEQIKQYNPDVILVFLEDTDRFKISQSLGQNFKSIFLDDFENSWLLSQAIAAGAKGYLHSRSRKEDLLRSIYTVSRGGYYFAPGILDRNMALFTPLSPSANTLEQWTCLLAKETIVQWRFQPLKKSFSQADLIKDLGLIFTEKKVIVLEDLIKQNRERDIFKDLQLKLNKIRARLMENTQLTKERIDPKALLDQAERVIEDWFIDRTIGQDDSSCLQSSANVLRIQILEKFQNSLTLLFQTVGTENLLVFLQDFQNYLKLNYKNCNDLKKEFLDRENSALRSYNVLKARLKKHSQSQEMSQDWKSAWRALYLVYCHKIQSEVYCLSAQLALDLIHQVKTYINVLDRTNTMLTNLQERFAARASVNASLMPLLFTHLIEKVSPDRLRSEIETKTSYLLNQWGTIPTISEENLQDYMLSYLRPATEEIYQQICREVIGF